MVGADVDISEATQLFRRLEGRTEDLRPFLRGQRANVGKHLRDHFSEHRGPNSTWPDWARATEEKFRGELDGRGRRRNVVNRRRRFGRDVGELNKRGERRRGNLLGRLKSAWNFTIDRALLMVESRVPWSGIHQEGGVAGHGARIPARPFMHVTGPFLERFRDELVRWIQRGNWR